jgi:hypothetical protein
MNLIRNQTAAAATMTKASAADAISNQRVGMVRGGYPWVQLGSGQKFHSKGRGCTTSS